MPAADTVDECDIVSAIAPGLFVSGLVRPFPPSVDAVMCLCLPSEMAHARRHGYPDPLACGIRGFAWRPIEDDADKVPPLDWLNTSAALIEEWLWAGRTVLVHCAAGISRSPTVAAAALMRRHSCSAADALRTLRKGRSIIDPNPGLVALLKEYEEFVHSPAARRRFL